MVLMKDIKGRRSVREFAINPINPIKKGRK